MEVHFMATILQGGEMGRAAFCMEGLQHAGNFAWPVLLAPCNLLHFDEPWVQVKLT